MIFLGRQSPTHKGLVESDSPDACLRPGDGRKAATDLGELAAAVLWG